MKSFQFLLLVGATNTTKNNNELKQGGSMKKNAIIALLATYAIWNSRLIEWKTNFPIIAFLAIAMMIFLVIEVIEETIAERKKNAKDKDAIADTIRKHCDADTSAS